MTIGEDRVRVKFNPSDNSLVSQIKQKTAELIDLCDQQKGLFNQKDDVSSFARAENGRCWSLAQAHYEDAAMWAVRAATVP